MLGFYDAVRMADSNAQNIVMTVLSGDDFGEKALVSDHKIMWQSKEDGYFTIYEKEIKKIEDSGRFEIGGQEVFCELLGQEKKIVICGGGHISIPVIRMSNMIGFQTIVLEDRPLFADHARRAGASIVFCDPFEKGLEKVRGDDDTFFVIVTRGHRYDRICLEKIANKKHAYIGMIGSRKRVKLLKESVIADGADPEVINRLYSPIGLSIGAETPEEIAVAIMAEIIEVKNKNRRSCGYPKEILQAICDGNSESDSFGHERNVLVTIVDRKGSAPRKVGTKMLILSDGRCIGTIGGGCAEAEILQKALQMIRENPKEPLLCHVDMTGKDAEEEGMVCGGVIGVLLEMV